MRTCVDYGKIILSNFPVNVQQRMVQSVQLAYSIADQVVEQNPWLNWSVGLDHLGYLRNIAVEHALKLMITNVQGLQCHIKPNHRKNFGHIEICSKDCILTVCQVHRPLAVPRQAVYRKNLASSNQLAIAGFEDEDLFQDHGDEPNYLILTHGCRRNTLGQSPSFIGIGFPNASGNAWHDFIDVTYLTKYDLIVSEDTTATTEEALQNDLQNQIDLLNQMVILKSHS